MKLQVTRLSPHQNGKVAAVMMALVSLVFLVPFLLIASAFGSGPMRGAGIGMMLLFPLLYLVMGYISVAIGCWVYNLIVQWTGGFEFESRGGEAG